MVNQDIRYALAKQVPDMVRGFTIATCYGDITIPPGWMADRIAQHVQRVLECELMGKEEIAPTRTTLSLEGDAAAQWLDDYATGKLAADGRDAHGFRLDQGMIGEFADLGGRHPAPSPCPADAAGQHAAPESQPPCDLAQPPATPGTDGGHQ